ncbi:hypothetical protein E2553_36090 [Paraburkholderia dipogonis]|uniref:Uncharacterized protein n=1 Tax=Paraburkholderia dipogonis TaxID=1211383 RepID=A0A4Y8MXD1_9BURK|nr:hypothetical protein [Paraburkholderia dipogonis]TFE42035.1 hypothetical protein E2553_36090 [Paraburkholderia dipogonis]
MKLQMASDLRPEMALKTLMVQRSSVRRPDEGFSGRKTRESVSRRLFDGRTNDRETLESEGDLRLL